MARRGSNAPLSDAQGRRATFAVAHVHVLFGGASARRCLCFRWVFGCWGACGPCSLCAAPAHGPPANVSSLRWAVRPRPAVPSQPEPRRAAMALLFHLAAPARGATSNTALPRATPESLLPAFSCRSPVVSRPTVTPLMRPEFTFVPFVYLNVFR